jgi:hypothetical protein
VIESPHTREEPTSAKSAWRYYIIAALAAAGMFLPVVRATIYSTTSRSTDFIGYDPFVRHMREWGMITRPNFLYPLLLLVGQDISHSTLSSVHLVVTLMFYALLAIVLLFICEQYLGVIRTARTGTSYLLLSLALMVIAPFNLLTPHLYFGYVAISVYHNASIALVRPLALLHFFFTTRLVAKTGSAIRRTILWSLPVLTILSALAKPNYVLALIPALAVWCGYRAFRKEPTDFGHIIGLIIAPALLVLGWQFAFTYLFPNPDIESSTVIFAPFKAYLTHSNNLALKFFLSILFPVAVAVCYGARFKSEPGYVLAWILFGAGLFFTYGFAEAGIRLTDMNFAWSGQITLFLLCVFSMLPLYRTVRDRGALDARAVICLTAFVLQFVAGINWYVHEWLSPADFW